MDPEREQDGDDGARFFLRSARGSTYIYDRGAQVVAIQTLSSILQAPRSHWDRPTRFSSRPLAAQSVHARAAPPRRRRSSMLPRCAYAPGAHAL